MGFKDMLDTSALAEMRKVDPVLGLFDERLMIVFVFVDPTSLAQMREVHPILSCNPTPYTHTADFTLHTLKYYGP